MGLKPRALKLERMPVLVMAIVALLAGMWAALLRLGWVLPAAGVNLPAEHGPLMVSGFLGTLITLERAVALGGLWAYGAPALTGAGAMVLLAGVAGLPGPLLITLGSIALMADFVLILRRQNELFTVAMALGAVAWVIGNALWMAGWPIPEMTPWWMAFLVLTIMGERLELSRLSGPSPAARPAFALATGLLLSGLALLTYGVRVGFAMLGAGMLGFAAWIALFDVARRTARHGGLPGFVAANLLFGAFWLGMGGAMRLAFPLALDFFQYDAILHAVFLGFVFSMIFAHAPIIFPAIMGRPLPFLRLYYLHVAALQLSLVLRIGGDLAGLASAWHWGGTLNVAAVIMFLADTAYGIAFGARLAGVAAEMAGVARAGSLGKTLPR